MDGRKQIAGNLVERITTALEYEKPKGYVVGFVPVCEFVENGEIIANLAYVIANRGFTVCVVDFKVFYPNLFDWLGGVSSNKKAEGLIRLLHSDRTEVKDVALKTDDEHVFLISPSPNDDIEDYLNFSIEDIKRVILQLKEAFDVVLIDIPNNPPLEFCLGALMHCQRGFFVASERIESLRNIQKLSDFALKVMDNIRSFNNIILARQQQFNYDNNSLANIEIISSGEKNRLKVAAKIPFIKSVQECALEGKVYIRDGSYVNKYFAREIRRLTDIILEVNA
jgi:MinD-like ATPase involved in chromosome partitioning or flagellar assembly